MKRLLFYILIIAAFAACTPPEVGYISDDIHALEDTVFVPRGIFMTSAAPNAEGSTYPMHWEITEVRDEAGNSTDVLFEPHEILIWREAYNGDTDTTLALAQEKLELAEKPTLLINDVSGELGFTQASKFVTNDIFNIDVNVTNVKGERQLNDFVTLKLTPFKPVEFPGRVKIYYSIKKTDGGTQKIFETLVTNDYDDQVPSVLDGTHPIVTILKTSEEPTLGVKMRMVIEDHDGDAIMPIPFYWNGSDLTNYSDNSVETVVDESGSTFALPAPPFPQFDRNGWGMYYTTAAGEFTIDKAAYEVDNGPVDWSQYETDANGDIIANSYFNFGFKINDTGTWELKVKFPYAKALP